MVFPCVPSTHRSLQITVCGLFNELSEIFAPVVKFWTGKTILIFCLVAILIITSASSPVLKLIGLIVTVLGGLYTNTILSVTRSTFAHIDPTKLRMPLGAVVTEPQVILP